MRSVATFKELSFKKKVGFIWDYYKYQILLALLCIVFFVSQINNVLTHKEPLMSIIMVNLYNTESEECPKGFSVFLDQYEYESYDGAIELIDQIHITDNVNKTADVQNLQFLLTMLIAENPEVYLGPRDLLQNYASHGYFADISAIVPDQYIEEYQDRLIYAEIEDTEERILVGVSLEGNKWLKDNHYEYEECYFGVPSTVDNFQIAKEFVEYIIAIEFTS